MPNNLKFCPENWTEQGVEQGADQGPEQTSKLHNNISFKAYIIFMFICTVNKPTHEKLSNRKIE